ncbi:outer membrane protein assembly factor BamB family protein [Cesiribacter andamanensis]|uniref:Pyrrolo-quinoline quinone repeat domain-containing protein n=1 Tax=Cesiribacter andamanensis AMV16 TaxID=1279009 RepID=M7N847_9BACT|nr:PQQ-binding-like beta-propeller repeat protein [Cesiribacter andamanensis]EMR04753.1 hypothetical protein ADICEAN_00024 [Cesiribacter andamanensis AMV16]
MKKIGMLLVGSSLLFGACDSRREADTTSQAPAADTTASQADASTRAPRLEQAWATEAELDVPESVFYNPDENMLYVSNIVGNPTDKDGKGFISKLSLDGKLVQKEWVSGLHAPKGMAMQGGTLYVTDIDALVAIDANGKISKRYPVKGAKFLNDPVAANGMILFTDMQDNKIYALENDKVRVWKENGLSSPNGLAYHNGAVYLASSDFQQITAEGEGDVLASGIGSGDGIGIVDENTFLVSNWQGEVYYVERGKEKVKLLDTKADKINSADITYVPEQNLLLVPTFSDNRVVAYRLQR